VGRGLLLGLSPARLVFGLGLARLGHLRLGLAGQGLVAKAGLAPLGGGGFLHIVLGPVALGQVVRVDVLGQLLADHAGPNLLDLADPQGPQREGTIGQADQPVDLQAHRFQHLADLAVLALGQGDGDPEVGHRRPFLGLVQLGLQRAVAHAVDGHAVLQGVELVLGDAAMGAGAIAAHDAGLGRLQRPGQLAVIGQQQQALGIQVQATDGDQPGQAGWQGLEHRRAALRVLVGGHQADGLVIAEQAGRLGLAHHLAIDGEDIARLHLHSRGGQGAAVDGHAPGLDQPLDIAARGDARPGQGLGDSFTLALLA